ncbi:MAG: Dabb family protein [Deltaproteobacteria bacterium]|nr:Dabb family protein [Deltaproteobacteria bacterium]
MIKHVVVFRFSRTSSIEAVMDVMNGFGQLRAQIPEILDYRWGYNNSHEGLNQEFNVGFEMLLANEAARQRYLEHPAHVEFAATKVLPLLEAGRESIVVFDFDVPARFALGINLGGPALVVEGNAWLSFDEARQSILDVGQAQQVSMAVEPMPYAASDTAAMLSTGIYGEELHLSVRVPDGRYQLFLWVQENWRTNHRAMNVRVGTHLVAENIAAFTKGQWGKFGPYQVEVENGELKIDVVNPRRDDAHMHLMGLALFAL